MTRSAVRWASLGLTSGGLFLLAASAATAAGVEAERGFIENLGQWDRRARYCMRLGETASQPRCRLDVWLTETGYTYSLLDPSEAVSKVQPVSRHVIAVGFAGASKPIIEAKDPLPGMHNWLMRGDASRRATGVRSFRRVVYREVYPGIDVTFVADVDPGGMESTYVVTPGAEPSAIALSFEGADAVRVDSTGNLVLATSLGDITELGPTAFQVAAAGRREPVPVAFVVEGRMVRFAVGAYDRTRPLVIDPVVVFSGSFGGAGADFVASMHEDATGRYFTGVTYSTDFPTTTGSWSPTSAGSFDWFASKFSPADDTLIWSTYLGGSDCYHGGNSALSDGMLYLVGPYCFDGRCTEEPTSAWDVAIVQLSAGGDSVVASKVFGGSAADFGGDIEVAPDGSLIVCGATYRPTRYDFPRGEQPGYSFSPSGGFDAFIARFSPDLSTHHSTTLVPGSSDFDGCSSLAFGPDGNLYVTGTTWHADWGGTGTIGPGGNHDLFVAKFDPTLTTLFYDTRIGGADTEPTVGWGYLRLPAYDANVAYQGLAVDGLGRAWVTGMTASRDFPTTAGAYSRTNAGNYDVFVLALNAAGTALDYGTLLGGSDTDTGRALGFDSRGNVYVTGSTASRNYPVTEGAAQTANAGNYDLLLSVLNSDLSQLLFSTYWGGPETEVGSAVIVGPDCHATIAGSAYTGFPQVPREGASIGPRGSYDGAHVRVRITVTVKPSLPCGARLQKVIRRR